MSSRDKLSNELFNSADLTRAIDGPRIAIPRASIQALGLEAAAFLQQASFLSSLKAEAGGWFDLPAEGEPDPEPKNIFSELGSWQACLGIQRDALRKIRRKLCDMCLLEEKRSGVPARLHYRVNHNAYLLFLADCGQKIQSAKIAIWNAIYRRQVCKDHAYKNAELRQTIPERSQRASKILIITTLRYVLILLMLLYHGEWIRSMLASGKQSVRKNARLSQRTLCCL